jgi:hypothetical protein
MLLPNFFRRNTQKGSHVLHCSLCNKSPLRTTKTSKSGVGDVVCFANLSSGPEIFKIVGIVRME